MPGAVCGSAHAQPVQPKSHAAMSGGQSPLAACGRVTLAATRVPTATGPRPSPASSRRFVSWAVPGRREPWPESKRVRKPSGPVGHRPGPIPNTGGSRGQEHSAGTQRWHEGRTRRPAWQRWRRRPSRSVRRRAGSDAAAARTCGRAGTLPRPQRRSPNASAAPYCRRWCVLAPRRRPHPWGVCTGQAGGTPRDAGRASRRGRLAGPPSALSLRSSVRSPRSGAPGPWRPHSIAWALGQGRAPPGGPPGGRVSGITIGARLAPRGPPG